MHEWMFLRLVVLLLAFGAFVAIAIVTGVRDNHRDSTRQRDRAGLAPGRQWSAAALSIVKE
jgi:hypothetical protein